jgi:hypothetical protein
MLSQMYLFGEPKTVIFATPKLSDRRRKRPVGCNSRDTILRNRPAAKRGATRYSAFLGCQWDLLIKFCITLQKLGYLAAHVIESAIRAADSQPQRIVQSVGAMTL